MSENGKRFYKALAEARRIEAMELAMQKQNALYTAKHGETEEYRTRALQIYHTLCNSQERDVTSVE